MGRNGTRSLGCCVDNTRHDGPGTRLNAALDHSLSEFLPGRTLINDPGLNGRRVDPADLPHRSGTGRIDALQRCALLRSMGLSRRDDCLAAAFDDFGWGARAMVELGNDGLAGLVGHDTAQQGGCGEEHDDDEHGQTRVLSSPVASFQIRRSSNKFPISRVRMRRSSYCSAVKCSVLMIERDLSGTVRLMRTWGRTGTRARDRAGLRLRVQGLIGARGARAGEAAARLLRSVSAKEKPPARAAEAGRKNHEAPVLTEPGRGSAKA